MWNPSASHQAWENWDEPYKTTYAQYVAIQSTNDALFAAIAKKQGDLQLPMMFISFCEDSSWHQSWNMHLLELNLKAISNNKKVIHG